MVSGDFVQIIDGVVVEAVRSPSGMTVSR